MSRPNASELLARLFAETRSKKKSKEVILRIHQSIEKELNYFQLRIDPNCIDLSQELADAQQAQIDQEMTGDCISLIDLYEGRGVIKIQESLKRRGLIKKKEEYEKERKHEDREAQSIKKDYNQKLKEWQRQKQQLERKKNQEERRKQRQRLHEEKILRDREAEHELAKKQEKRKKLEEAIKEIELRKKAREERTKEIKGKRSQSLKTLPKPPKYIELEKQYLQKERQKQLEAQQIAKKKQFAKAVKLEQIKAHQKAYIEKIKEKLGANPDKEKVTTANTERKVKSDFQTFVHRDEEEEQKCKDKMARRKQFESRIRNLPISIDPLKRKEKQMEVDKLLHKKKYNLLSSRALNDDQIYEEFKDFEIAIDAREIGKNYLDEVKLANRALGSKRTNSVTQAHKSERREYHNYLQELRAKKSDKAKPQTLPSDELMQLVERSKKYLPSEYAAEFERQFTGPQSSRISEAGKLGLQNRFPSMMQIRRQDEKREVTRSITDKIAEYEKKVYKKVKDLKQISEYGENIDKEGEIDDLYSKVLIGKLASLQLN